MSHKRKYDPAADAPPLPDAGELLASVAAALAACEAAGFTVRLKHGAVMTRVGYVLPLGDGEWAARTLNWTEFSPPPGSNEDDLPLARAVQPDHLEQAADDVIGEAVRECHHEQAADQFQALHG